MWPTPRAEDSEQTGGHRGKADTLTAAMRARGHFPTPRAADAKCPGPHESLEGGPSLSAAIRSWPTPTAGDARSSGSRNTEASKAHPGVSLTDAVRGDGGTGREIWPTPAARDYRHPNLKSYAERGGGKKGEQLNNAVVHRYPTPTTPGPHQVGTIAEWGGRNNPLRTADTMTLEGGALNPQFVEWLMGYPKDYTQT
jgi:hypothetical protein